ncbi:MAG TPA: hypothetical protein VJ991_03595 [Balneolales bacterium]|nr:hypothetical protein [Balneolales bacterium]
MSKIHKRPKCHHEAAMRRMPNKRRGDNGILKNFGVIPFPEIAINLDQRR